MKDRAIECQKCLMPLYVLYATKSSRRTHGCENCVELPEELKNNETNKTISSALTSTILGISHSVIKTEEAISKYNIEKMVAQYTESD